MKNNLSVLLFKKTFAFDDLKLIISFISISSGIVSGVLVCRLSLSEIDNKLYDLFIDFNMNSSVESALEIFSHIVANGLLYFVAMFIVGGSIFGKLLSPLITFFKAVGLGVLTSYLYCNFGLKGFEYALLVFFPGKIVLLFSMLFITKICIENSFCLVKSEVNIKNYCIKTSVVLAAFIISWAIDLFCTVIFSDLFNFA